MVKTSIKTSITNSKAIPVATKFSVSYVRVSTKAQTKEDKSGIERQEQDYLNWLERNPNYRNLDGFEFRDLGVSGRGKIAYMEQIKIKTLAKHIRNNLTSNNWIEINDYDLNLYVNLANSN